MLQYSGQTWLSLELFYWTSEEVEFVFILRNVA